MDPNAPGSLARETPLATPGQLRESLREAGKLGAYRAVVRAALEQHRQDEGPLMPILHTVQDSLGHVPAGVVGDIAEGLNLSRAEVHGVVSYYHHFRAVPAGRHVLQVCRAESCQAMGCETLWQGACTELGLPPEGGTTADGAVTLEPVYCLGLCAMSPAAALDEAPHARLNAAKLGRLLDRARADAGAPAAPAGVDRVEGASSGAAA